MLVREVPVILFTERLRKFSIALKGHISIGDAYVDSVYRIRSAGSFLYVMRKETDSAEQRHKNVDAQRKNEGRKEN